MVWSVSGVGALHQAGVPIMCEGLWRGDVSFLTMLREKKQKASMSLGEKLYDVRATVGMWRWTIELLAFSKSSFSVSDFKVHHFNSLSSSNCLTQTTSKLWIFVLFIFLTLVNQNFPFSIQFSYVMLTFKSIIVQYLVSKFSMCLTNPNPVFV